VNYPLIFYWKDAKNNPASIDLAKVVLKHITKNLDLPRGDLYSDFLVFPGTVPAFSGLLIPICRELSGSIVFHQPTEEQRLKQTEYNRKEAEAYFAALVEYFSNGMPTAELIEPKPGISFLQRILAFDSN